VPDAPAVLPVLVHSNRNVDVTLLSPIVDKIPVWAYPDGKQYGNFEMPTYHPTSLVQIQPANMSVLYSKY